jgi:hypothetical protein
VRPCIERGTIQSEKVDGVRYVLLSDSDMSQHAGDASGDMSHDSAATSHDSATGMSAFVDSLEDQVDYLRRQLEVWQEEARRKDHIIAALTERIPELEPASNASSEERESRQTSSEQQDSDTRSSRSSRSPYSDARGCTGSSALSNRTTAKTCAIGFLVLITLFGSACGSEGNDQGSTSQDSGEVDTSTAPDDTATETTKAQSKDQASSRQDLRIGETATFEYEDTTTVYSYTDPAQPVDGLWTPTPGTRYAAIEVEGCAGTVEVTDPDANTQMPFNGFLFALQMPDNTRIPPGVPAINPVLPATNLPAGECVRGNVTFEVPEGQTPTYVVLDSGIPPARWAIG